MKKNLLLLYANKAAMRYGARNSRARQRADCVLLGRNSVTAKDKLRC